MFSPDHIQSKRRIVVAVAVAALPRLILRKGFYPLFRQLGVLKRKREFSNRLIQRLVSPHEIDFPSLVSPCHMSSTTHDSVSLL